MTHFLYVPFTGLGLYNGYRGSRWLRNRIQIFKQFVVPSMENQTSQNFIIWASWRPQEKRNKQVKELYRYLVEKFGEDRVVFTYHGVCFYDDKYPEDVAHERLVSNLHGTMSELINYVGDVENVLMTIQPSDDCYNQDMVQSMQDLLGKTDYQAAGYTKGYIMNYATKELREYNPDTNPPFFTIKFPKEIFMGEAFSHAQYTGPYKSHEYIGNHMKYLLIPERGFLVGCHGENISTHFNHPFAGKKVGVDPVMQVYTHYASVTESFGIRLAEPLQIKYSFRKALLRRLPYGWQRKLRYTLGEKLYDKFYRFIRA